MKPLPPIPGPTGTFENEPYSPNDQGGLMGQLTVDYQKQRLVMRFGAAVTFLVMTPGEAEVLAEHLLSSVKKLRGSREDK